MKVAPILKRLRGLPPPSALPEVLLLLSTLRDAGWYRSVKSQTPLDASGEALPWWAYGAIGWLDAVLQPTHRVFEYGSGGSTIWLAQRVNELTSIESDARWYEKVSARVPGHTTLRLVPTSGTEADATDSDPYATALDDESGEFDLVIVDGMARNNCVRAATGHVGSAGLILLDDADRLSFAASHHLLNEQGFGRIDFSGPRPGVGHISTTSVFCRDFAKWVFRLPPPEPSGY